MNQDEFDELELETIAAAHLDDKDNDCDDEQQIDEYGDYNVAAHHRYNNKGGCLILVATYFLFVASVLLLILVI